MLGILEDIWNINLKERRTKIIQKEGYQKKWFLYQRMWQNFSKDNCSDKMESDSKTISVYQIYYDLLVKMFVNQIINSRLFLFLLQDYLTASLLFFAIHKHVKYVLFLYQSIQQNFKKDNCSDKIKFWYKNSLNVLHFEWFTRNTSL